MPTFDLGTLAKACGGKLLRGDPATTVDRYSIDTRKLTSGSVFFAMRGRHADGHRFVADATRAGAAAAVIEREPENAGPHEVPHAVIHVENTEHALTECGRLVRREFESVNWVALTGSNGKTTTKEMIAAGLGDDTHVHRTPGNFNNHLGVPLSLLSMPDSTEIAVLELAMSGPDEIAELTRLTRPKIGLVTNMRSVHMASFRTLDDVAAAKGELFALLDDDATAIVNLDDMHVRVQAARHIGPRVTYGTHADADLRIEQVINRLTPGAELTVRHRDRTIVVPLSMGGAHNAYNALAALAVIVAIGADPVQAAERIGQVEAGPGRGRVHQLAGGVVLVDDTYNSSPPALAAVLETIRLTEARRKVLVLGDMLELGSMEQALRAEAGRRAAAAGVEMLAAVGTLSRDAAEAGRRAGVPLVHHFVDSRIAAAELPDFVRDGDLIVVKGSRGLRMGRVARALIEARGVER